MVNTDNAFDRLIRDEKNGRGKTGWRKKRKRKKHKHQTYAEYMASPAWTAKRKAALKYHGAKCNRCGVTGVSLQVHHKTYKGLGNERMRDLEVLCVDCHTVEHEKKHGPGGELYEEFKRICG